LDLLTLTSHELDIALAQEKRARVRRRLLAVKKVLGGMSRKQAAKSVKAGIGSVDRWLRIARQLGCAVLVSDGKELPRKRRMNRAEAALARAKLQDALQQTIHWRARKRLVAVDQMLAGKAPLVVAREACVTPHTVRQWLTRLQSEGVGALLGTAKMRLQDPLIVADAGELRALAAKKQNTPIAKRLLAMANLADGMSVTDAAVRAGAHRDTLRIWLADFQKSGIQDLQRNPKGRPAKLTDDQLAELRKIILATPSISYQDLGKIVEQKFNVRYAQSGLTRLVRQRLGFAR
jgi:transposase